MTLLDVREMTVLDALMEGAPLGLPSRVRLQTSGDLVPIGLDNGNGHTKVAVLSDDGQLVTQTVPTVYRTAREIRGGAGIVRYTVNSGSQFWIGGEALNHEGDALPIGATAERVGDRRQREFLAAGLVESLLAAGYQPGIYNLAVGLAIPNDEIVLKKDGEHNKLGVSKETRTAIKEHLLARRSTSSAPMPMAGRHSGPSPTPPSFPRPNPLERTWSGHGSRTARRLIMASRR